MTLKHAKRVHQKRTEGLPAAARDVLLLESYNVGDYLYLIATNRKGAFVEVD